MEVHLREQQSHDKMDQEESAKFLNSAIDNTRRMGQKEFDELYNTKGLFAKLLSFRNDSYDQLLAKAQIALKKGKLSEQSFLEIQTLIQEEVKSLDQIIGDDLLSMYKRLTLGQFVKYFADHSFPDQTLVFIVEYHQKQGLGWSAACKHVLDELKSGGFPEKDDESFKRNMRKGQRRLHSNLK